jgi:hypothetical protein
MMRVQGPFKREGAYRTALRTVLQRLQPMFDKAEAEKLFFRCRYSGLSFTPKQLLKELKAGRWIRTPQHWHLIDAQNRRVA